MRERLVAMWSVRCALAGHNDTFSRTPHRLALECLDCGRTTRGWVVGTTKEDTRMDKWTVTAAAIPATGVFGWILVRFIEWRRRLRASMWGHIEGEG
jgi:hypothetical protein